MRTTFTPTVSDFRKLINNTKDKTIKASLKKMCTNLCKSDRSIASTTPVLPRDIVFFFKSKHTMQRLRDVRKMPHVLAFIEWRSGFNDFTTMQKRDLGGVFDLCVKTLVCMYGGNDTLIGSMLRQFFCGQTHVFSYFDQALCLHNGYMVCSTSCAQTRNNVVSFLSGICSHVPMSTGSTAALYTSMSFKQTKSRLGLLTSWTRSLTRSLFGHDASCVLVVRFKTCVRVFHEKDNNPTVMFVLHAKSDRVFCKEALFLTLQANNLCVTQKQLYVDVTFLHSGGIYKL